MKRFLTPLLTLCLVFAVIGTAQSALTFVTQRSSLGGNDFVDWGTLGAAIKTVQNPFDIVSNLGLPLNVSMIQAEYSFRRVDQWSGTDPFTGWDGNFAIGDKALWTGYDPSPLAYHNGPMTIVFESPILGAGVQIQANEPLTFVATIEAYDPANNSLGSFEANGSYNTHRDNSAIFIGVKSDAANIAKLVFNVTQVAPAPFMGDRGFAVNRLDLIVTGLSPANPIIQNGATNVSIRPQFSWQAVSGAAAYDLYLWKEGTTKPAIPTQEDITNTGMTLAEPLDPLTAYRWQVAAKKAPGQATGPEWTFTTGNFLVGDVNDDKTINLQDAIMALQAIGGLNPVDIRADFASSGAYVNLDGKIGLPEAIYVLQKAAGLRSGVPVIYSMADLAGTWETNKLGASASPWWSRGTFTAGSDGSFSGPVNDSSGQNSSVSGTFGITTDGIVSVNISGATLPPSYRCVMNSGKSVVVCTATTDGGNATLDIFAKKALSYSVADLAGTWEVNKLGASASPWWSRGTFTAGSDGLFSGTSNDSSGHSVSVSGAFSITSDGIVGISIQSSTVPASYRCVMDSGKSVVVCTATTDGGNATMDIFTKKVSPYSMADLAGTWETNRLGASASPWWSRGTFTAGSDGSFSGPVNDSFGQNSSVSGAFGIATDGIVSVNISGATLPPSYRCVMNSGKSVVVCTATTDGGNATLDIFTKKREH